MAKRSTKTTKTTTPLRTPPISEEAKRLFNALTSGTTRFDSPGERRFEGFALLSVLYDNEPTNAIVHIKPSPRGDGFIVAPQFIQVTDSILDKLRDPYGAAVDG